jgi:hypothetical protein
MSDTLLFGAALAGLGSEAAGVTNFTPIGPSGDDGDDSGGGGGTGSQIITVPGGGNGLEGIGEVFDSINRPQQGGLGELAAAFEEVSQTQPGLTGGVTGRFEDLLVRQRERFEDTRDEWEETREEWEERADTATEGGGTDFQLPEWLTGGDDSGGPGGSDTSGSDSSGSGGTPSAFDTALERYASGEPLVPNVADLPGEGDPAGFVEEQVDTVFGTINPNDPRGFESPTNDLPETGEYGAVGDGLSSLYDSAKDVASSDTGKVEETAEKFKKATDPGGDEFFGDELAVEAEGTTVVDPEDREKDDEDEEETDSFPSQDAFERLAEGGI